jgi:hypothetical protein
MEEGFTREPIFEKQFKNRYNREVEVYRRVLVNEDKTLQSSTQKITYKDDEYTVQEYFKKDGSTDYVMSGDGKKMSKYEGRGSIYLEAEVHVVDLIGKKEYGHIR